MKKYLAIITFSLLALLTAACTPYKVPIEQGNIITQEMVDQLKPGMSKSQVEYIMGAPLFIDTFNDERWNYVYRLSTGKEVQQQHRLTIYFNNDFLERFSGDFTPTPAAAAGDEGSDAEDGEKTLIPAPSDDSADENAERRAQGGKAGPRPAH